MGRGELVMAIERYILQVEDGHGMTCFALLKLPQKILMATFEAIQYGSFKTTHANATDHQHQHDD